MTEVDAAEAGPQGAMLQALDEALGELRRAAADLARQIRDETATREGPLARGTGTPWEALGARLDERVTPLSRKDAYLPALSRRLSGEERRLVRLSREAEVLREERVWLLTESRRLHAQSERSVEWGQAVAAWSQALLEQRRRLGGWTDEELERRRHRLEALEVGQPPSGDSELP